jgi:hypothetical protein
VRSEVLDVRSFDDRGVARFRMAGMLGGVPVEQTIWQAVKLREGRARWWAFFRTEREAVEAVALQWLTAAQESSGRLDRRLDRPTEVVRTLAGGAQRQRGDQLARAVSFEDVVDG